MADPLNVLLGGELAGVLDRHQRRPRFVYDDAYRSVGGTPLSLSMPLVDGEFRGDVVANWLWNLLPENELVLDRWAREFQVSARDPVAMLSSPVGHDCAGAVQFATDNQLGELVTRSREIRTLTHDELERRVDELVRDESSWLGPAELQGQFSLAGAQSKFALMRTDEGSWAVAAGAQPATHIFKPGVSRAPDGTWMPDQSLNEHLCMDAARRSLLLAARTELATIGEHRVIIISRYDRVVVDGELRRVHQEDLCQAHGLPASQKYQKFGGPSVREIARTIRRNVSTGHVEESLLQFLDALAYNWLIGGTDAHAKNYSLLLLGGDVRLAPLYDIASALPYFNARDRSVKLAMSLGGDYRVWPWANSWPKVAREFGMDEGLVIDRVRALAERVPDAFADAAAKPDVASLGVDLPVRLVDAVSAQVARCRAVLG